LSWSRRNVNDGPIDNKEEENEIIPIVFSCSRCFDGDIRHNFIQIRPRSISVDSDSDVQHQQQQWKEEGRSSSKTARKRTTTSRIDVVVNAKKKQPP
jgi:hypothetical protein